MHSSRVLIFSALVALACDGGTEPSGIGGVALQIASTGGATVLDSGRVHVDGPTDKTVSATPGSTVAITGLLPGSYTVSLEGFVGDEVDHFGRVTGVQVVAGQNTNATVGFASFVPVVDPLPPSGTSKTFTVQFGSVAGAASYEVEAATNQSFTTGRVAVAATQTSVGVTVAEFGTHYVRVRAIDPFQARGRPSASQSIALAPPRGVIYMIRDSDDMFQRMDPETLVITDIGPLGVGYAFGDCAWDPANSTLYMVDGPFDLNTLYRIDLTTGAATAVGVHGVGSMLALGYHPPTNALYGVGAKVLYRLSITDGSPTQIGATGTGGASIDGLVWDSARNQFVALTAGTEQFHTIDVATGAGTALTLPGAFRNNAGLAYDPIIDRFWVADFNGNIHKYDPAFAQTVAATGQGQHTCITYVP